ncbi:hypothetical protein ABZ413_29580 [Nocardia rhamnosiphila]|uniref:hypothetical protein n=1 Tax=Nocardia rhamnosiphila TaxID=426716 RepID=UPI0034072873
MPTEDEIRAAAKRLGLADENGNYKQSQRSRIAAAIVRAEKEVDEAADPETAPTADALARFDADLTAVGFGEGTRGVLLQAAATHLLKTAGLKFRDLE